MDLKQRAKEIIAKEAAAVAAIEITDSFENRNRYSQELRRQGYY